MCPAECDLVAAGPHDAGAAPRRLRVAVAAGAHADPVSGVLAEDPVAPAAAQLLPCKHLRSSRQIFFRENQHINYYENMKTL